MVPGTFLIGDTDRDEFREARRMLEAITWVTALDNVESAIARLAEGSPPPEVIVLAQSYPGQFTPEAIERLRRLAPLARVVALLGTWCEGETRTGRPLPGVLRVYWHQWPARSRQLQRLVEGGASTWGLPVTATDEERMLAAADNAWPRQQGLAVICTRRSEMEGWLAAVCCECGLATVWLRPPRWTRVQGATVVLYDGSDGRGHEADEVRRLATELAPRRFIALLDAPRIEDTERLEAAGAHRVLAKPLLVEDLAWEMAEGGGGKAEGGRPKSTEYEVRST